MLLVITLDRPGRPAARPRAGSATRPSPPTAGRCIYWLNDEGDADGGALYRVAWTASSSRSRLTEGGDGEDADPVVLARRRPRSPSSRRQAPVRNVVTAPFDGTALTDDARRSWTGDENDQDPSWSPDGRRIAYKQGPNRNGDLRVVDLDSGASRRGRRQRRPGHRPGLDRPLMLRPVCATEWSRSKHRRGRRDSDQTRCRRRVARCRTGSALTSARRSPRLRSPTGRPSPPSSVWATARCRSRRSCS